MKVPYATQVERAVAQRARAAVRGMQRIAGAEYTLSQLTTEALDRYVRDLEERHNAGQPWPLDDEALARGRRIS